MTCSVCRVVQAPWRMPGADPADFFNYGLNINTWKEYVQSIHQFRLEFTMQKKIQTYESNHDVPALDPDLPPELAAAVGQGRQQVSVVSLVKTAGNCLLQLHAGCYCARGLLAKFLAAFSLNAPESVMQQPLYLCW